MRIPLSTYRLQFSRAFGFRQARELVPYLDELGVTDVYASPIFHARTDSSSGGYDIVDPTSLSPALGSWDDFVSFCTELKRRDMGLLLDIVPNHMAAHSSNVWWKDVLENGPGSPYAHYFDIEWDPPSRSRGAKILWPILGAPYAEALERKELVLTLSEEGFAVRYFDRLLPIDPATYGAILSLSPRLTASGGQTGASGQAAALAEVSRSLPPSSATDPESAGLRRRRARELKRGIWESYAADEGFRSLVEHCVETFNGEAGDPRSFDLLDELLGQQPYVLSYWRVAREKVNYRRFFDISGLVGVDVEEPAVFAATHALVFQLVDEGWVTGLRIDHIDGLYDPTDYLRRLRERLPGCFLVVEKILERNETLCPEWPVSGTTGYDFANALSGAMLNPAGLDRATEAYRRLTGLSASFDDVIYQERKRAIERLFVGEAHALALHLNLLAESDRYAKDASPQELYSALVEVTACMPVYRTYTRSFQIRSQDILHLDTAFQEARRRNPGASETIWTFLRRVLLLDCPPSLAAEQRAGWKQLVQRWQQFSGPVMAKGKEDTAFYTYNRLISMNEVGGQGQAWSTADFHRFAESRAKCWPHSLNAGTTHDSKRGEDVRARIHALAEGTEWEKRLMRWRRWNARAKRALHGVPVPGPNEECYIYQTLLGAWPVDSAETDAFQERLQATFVKSWREAKLYTSWSNPDEEYERAVADFVGTILAPTPENRFLPDFTAFRKRIAAYGVFNSLSETLVRLASPGVPDIYQGSELWELSLVDPDNRRPVDFARRKALLDKLPAGDLPALLRDWRTGAIKQYVVQRTLACRRDHADVFRNGEYVPLEVDGRRADHVLAFARHSGMAWVIAVAPRFPAELSKSTRPPVGKRLWAETDLSLPPEAPRRWSNRFTGGRLEVSGVGRAPLGSLLERFPLALLAALPN